MTSSAREVISDVLVRYCTAIDTLDWPLLGQCFTPDCRVSYNGRLHEGLPALTRHLETGHTDLDGSLHRLTNVAIEVDGSKASARSYVHVLLVRREHPDGPTWEAFGTYTDTLACTGDQWLISERVFVATWNSGTNTITGRAP